MFILFFIGRIYYKIAYILFSLFLKAQFYLPFIYANRLFS